MQRYRYPFESIPPFFIFVVEFLKELLIPEVAFCLSNDIRITDQLITSGLKEPFFKVIQPY